jgi:hypothetical protein
MTEISLIYKSLANRLKKNKNKWLHCFISAVSWRPGLVVEEAESAENHRPWASNW